MTQARFLTPTPSSTTAASTNPGYTAETSSLTTVPPAEGPLTFYIQNTDFLDGASHHLKERLKDIPTDPPVELRRPHDPMKRALGLKIIDPCIFYVQYPCEQGCRNLGICIHFQFVVGAKRCPDGLRCDVCVEKGDEWAITANRKCPLHQIRNQANPISSRPEDFLANQAQKAACEEVLLRSFHCRWDDLPPRPNLPMSPNLGLHGNIQNDGTHLQHVQGFENHIVNEPLMGFDGGSGDGNDAKHHLMGASDLGIPSGYSYATVDN